MTVKDAYAVALYQEYPDVLFYTVKVWLQIEGVDLRHNMTFVCS